MVLTRLTQPKTAAQLEAFRVRVMSGLMLIGALACVVPWVFGMRDGSIAPLDRYGLPVLLMGFLGSALWLRLSAKAVRVVQQFVLLMLATYSLFDFVLLSLPVMQQTGAGGSGLPWFAVVLIFLFFNHSERVAFNLGLGYLGLHLLSAVIYFRAGITYPQFNVMLQFFLANSITLGLLRITSQFRHSYQDLYEIAHTDALTGITNRRSMQSKLEQQFLHELDFGVLMIDIDHFKRINDSHGHGIGDQVLRELALLLETQTRTQEIVSRWGGEEFMVLASGCDRDVCEQIAFRLLESVRATRLAGLTVTISIGVAWREEAEPLESVVSRADRALYAAKANGRNRVEVASPKSVFRTQELPALVSG
jgi:diguanylate cyclase (GGDEF)-like protein